MRKEKQYQLAKRRNNQPASRKRYPPHRRESNNTPPINGRFFQGNLAQNMRFGGRNHDLSGYVQRTVVMKDRFGNVQIAKEKQFFTSSKDGHNLRVRDDEKY